MEEGAANGGFVGMGGNQGYYGSGQQPSNEQAFGQTKQGYGGRPGGGRQQQQDFGLPQHSGLQENNSTGPFGNQLGFPGRGSLQGSLPSMDMQQPQQQRTHSVSGPAQPGGAQGEASQWQQAFFKLAAAAGVPVDPSQGQPPEAVIEQVQAARRRDPTVQCQAREAAMQVQAAVLTAQNVNLRRELGSGWAAADSNMIQVQQLILDPAIEHEFQHLRAQLALRVSETEDAKAAYEGQAFTQDSKNGHALLRKVKMLTEENEDLGRQQREGRQAMQAAIAAVERRHADELREEVQELRDLCNFYQQENEELNMVTGLYQRQLDQIRQQLAAQPQPVPDRDFGRNRAALDRDRDGRPYDRPADRDRDRPPPPRDATPADRERQRLAERPRDRTAERREYPQDRSAPHERARPYDLTRRGGGHGGAAGRYAGGRHGGFGGRRGASFAGAHKRT